MTAATLTTLILVQAAAGPTVSAQVHEFTEFLGFSANEKVAAWRTRIEARRAGGSADIYILGTAASTATGAVIATFRAGEITRIDASGARVAVRRRTLLRANPRYRRALPRRQWERLIATAPLFAAPVDLTYPAVRIRADAGTRLHGDNRGDHLALRAAPGSAFAYQVTVRTVDNDRHPVCHFRRARQGSGELRAYASRRGRAVALVGTFKAPPASTAEVCVARLATPIATAQRPAQASGVTGIEEAYADYVGRWGEGVLADAKHPTVVGAKLGRSDARRLYGEYMQMLGN